MKPNVPLVVTIDQQTEDLGSGMLPPKVRQGISSIVEVNSENLAAQLKDVVDQLHELASSIKQESEQYEVEYIDFALGVSKNGKIGILSTLEGSTGHIATLTVRLKRK